MRARLTSAHALFQMDNDMLFLLLDEAVHDSEYANMIKPFERRRDGHGAYVSILGNHAGDDKWDRIIETAETYTQKKRWDGSSGVTLEFHFDKLKSSYIDLEAGAEHVHHQVSTPRTCVKLMLVSIGGCNDPALQAVIASIKNEINGLVDNFEGACRLLLPCCPVAKRHNNKRQNAQISATYGDEQGAPGKEWIPKEKVGTGPSGVEYLYYKPKDFRRLSQEMQTDLKAHRRKKNGGKDGKDAKKVRFDKKLKGKIASLVTKQVKEKVVAIEKENQDEQDEQKEIASIIAGMRTQAPAGLKVSAANAQKHSPDDLTMAAAVSINKIRRRKRGDAPK